MKIKVKAAPGVQVPREDNGRRYITDEIAGEVALTAYYQRQLNAGDLVVVTDDAVVAKKGKSEEVSRGES
ncbi:hypothetical protein GZ59_24690 [Pectobacterium atrosepticum]|uniref:hypothetical protein n=1 Tax=Pectobacterium atrosepticum TaxID=29471 RepID=UPI0004E85DC9|nr:hypothetical protein [Pectobacterium atrosepticum]AIK14266.1 hypothetical protein GZ59_24690 [Pectobacterium atrosepticum]KFX13248.1 hypothetical protein JV34_15620 [Pectobacterium atrosepticum]KMK81986.1 hypothetical protein KCQ_08076 [Pectobacterium atrosepticum ICMP 1526]